MSSSASTRIYNALIGYAYVFDTGSRTYDEFIADLVSSTESDQGAVVSALSGTARTNAFVYKACKIGIQELIPIIMQLATRRRTEAGVEVEFEDRVDQMKKLSTMYDDLYKEALAEDDAGSTFALLSGWDDDYEDS